MQAFAQRLSSGLIQELIFTEIVQNQSNPLPQHLDLSEKNFIEVDSSLLADAFSRFSPSIIEETTNVRSIVVGSLARTLLISLRLSDLILGIENTVQCLDFVR